MIQRNRSIDSETGNARQTYRTIRTARGLEQLECDSDSDLQERVAPMANPITPLTATDIIHVTGHMTHRLGNTQRVLASVRSPPLSLSLTNVSTAAGNPERRTGGYIYEFGALHAR